MPGRVGEFIIDGEFYPDSLMFLVAFNGHYYHDRFLSEYRLMDSLYTSPIALYIRCMNRNHQ